jgi:hypothetical protein
MISYEHLSNQTAIAQPHSCKVIGDCAVLITVRPLIMVLISTFSTSLNLFCQESLCLFCLVRSCHLASRNDVDNIAISAAVWWLCMKVISGQHF